ncbi:hypothetical protein ACFE04_007423 [Oxalis oulophora]
MAKTTTITTVLLLLVFLLPLSTPSGPVRGLDTILTRQSRQDPQATNDTYLFLSNTIKSGLYSSINSHTINYNHISSLLSLSIPISIHIRLVGPTFPSESSKLLHSFISSALTSSHFHVTIPPYHKLSLSHALHLDVSHAPNTLTSLLSSAIQSEIANTPSSLRSPLLSLSYQSIDTIISKDFDNQKPVQGVHLYLIHLGDQAKPYAYKYNHGDDSPGVTKCMGSIWTGKERYIWIDLAAGPVDYGPALSGDGVLPRGEFHPLAAFHGRPKGNKALLADLASLVHSAYNVLVVPSLRIPVYFQSHLTVEFVHIYASETPDTTGLDSKSIEQTFKDEATDGLLLGEQSLTFRSYSVSLAKCPICSFAVSRSINSYTSRFLFDNHTLIASEYLDSKRLHQILSESAEEFRKVLGIHEEPVGRVLPVYVFDLDDSSLLLLDRYHQSVAFKDMVIAVRTKNTQTVSDYSCNGRHVFTHTRELERPLVGSILQSMWGVSPTHLLWSSQHNNTLVDYTWSVGQTPFGPFSELMSLSFVQKDAARRNVILTSLNYSITSAIDVLQSISAHGGERKFLKNSQLILFTQRWNLFKYKLDKAVSALSHFEFEMALFYLRASDHDLYAIHSLVYHATQELEASLICFKDPAFPWFSVSMSAVTLFALLFAFANREKLFKNKRKQF